MLNSVSPKILDTGFVYTLSASFNKLNHPIAACFEKPYDFCQRLRMELRVLAAR
jgi:hypothetical protein